VIRGEFKTDQADPVQRLMLLMFHYSLWQQSLSDMRLGSLNDSVRKIRQNRYMVKELCDVLEYNYQHIQYVPQPVEFKFPCPLDMHCRYTRDEILAGFGLMTENQRVEFREGVKYIPSIQTDIFLITLYKSEHEYSPTTMYQDYAISDTLFHWQSQSTTSDASPTGQRYIHHQKTGNTILLFVREYKKERDFTSPYIFLGSANYVRHEGSRPMSILWKLTHPMPAHLWKEAGSLSVAG